MDSMTTAIPEKALRADGAYVFALEDSTNAVMRAVQKTIAQIAPTNIPVLLMGESGTGKERIAQHIHRLSSRCGEPLVKVVCSSLDGDNVAGYFASKGSDRDSSKCNGTLLLEEIGELSAASQRSLLYALPRRRRVLGRGIYSTSNNFPARPWIWEMKRVRGDFRPELYFRINGCVYDFHLYARGKRTSNHYWNSSWRNIQH